MTATAIWNPSTQTIRWWLKPIAHLLALSPFVWLLYSLFSDRLGFNPVEALTHQTGIWAFRFLLLCLVISPLRQLTRMIWLTQFRRMLGLYAFFYGLCHFLVYFLWDQGLSLSLVLEDISERPYITVGFVALCLLLALTFTSTAKIQRRMKQNWKRLHQLVYLSGALIALHFIWLTKADYLESGIYTLIFILLMLFRLPLNKIGIGKSK